MVLPPVPEGSPETVEEFRELLGGAAHEAGRPLGVGELEGMITHYRMLLKWGRRMNLTGLRDAKAIARRHFVEPVETADLIGEEGKLVDLGSGNGFPAIPIVAEEVGVSLGCDPGAGAAPGEGRDAPRRATLRSRRSPPDRLFHLQGDPRQPTSRR
jgi:hypothetical protein